MNQRTHFVVLTAAVLLLMVSTAIGALSAHPFARGKSPASEEGMVEDEVIHTAKIRMDVNQVGQIANEHPGSSFTYFADSANDRICDGSLILGNAADNLSWQIWYYSQPAPSPSNPYGPTLPLSHTIVDSTSDPSCMIVSTLATNRDSTIGFDVTYYAPKHVDSSDFFIVHFDLYKGRNDSLGVYSGLMVAFAADLDLPSDSVANNSGGCDEELQMLYQRGETTTTMRRQFGAISAFRDDLSPIAGGFIWDNARYVYPKQGFQADSVWKYTSLTNGFTSSALVTDLTSVLVIGKNLSINGSAHDTLSFTIVVSGQLDGSLTEMKSNIGKAKSFFCEHSGHYQRFCDECGMCRCGDANDDFAIDISDAVFLIAAIFNGGPTPEDCCYSMALGDANGDRQVDISDAVYIIARVFGGGPSPHCWGF
jgi:hypothetical protein